MLLMGWIPTPHSSQTWAIPRVLCTSIFSLNDHAGQRGGEEAQFDKEVLNFLGLLEQQPVGWDLQEEDKKALQRLRNILEGVEPGVAVHRDAARGCFVVVSPAGSRCRPGYKTVTVVEVTRRSGWTRGQGPEAILASQRRNWSVLVLLVIFSKLRQVQYTCSVPPSARKGDRRELPKDGAAFGPGLSDEDRRVECVSTSCRRDGNRGPGSRVESCHQTHTQGFGPHIHCITGLVLLGALVLPEGGDWLRAFSNDFASQSTRAVQEAASRVLIAPH